MEWGADPEALEATATSIEGKVNQVDAMQRMVRGLLYSLNWFGPDADKARSNWDSSAPRAFGQASSVIRECAAEIRSNAQQQREASAPGAGIALSNVVWPDMVTTDGTVQQGVGNGTGVDPSLKGIWGQLATGVTPSALAHELAAGGGWLLTPGTLAAAASVTAGVSAGVGVKWTEGSGPTADSVSASAEAYDQDSASVMASSTLSPDGEVTVKAEASMSSEVGADVKLSEGDQFVNATTTLRVEDGVSGNAGLGGQFGTHGMAENAQAAFFAGGQASATETVNEFGMSGSGTATGYLGVGANFDEHVSVTPNDVSLHISAGAALGLGAGFTWSVQEDPMATVHDIENFQNLPLSQQFGEARKVLEISDPMAIPTDMAAHEASHWAEKGLGDLDL